MTQTLTIDIWSDVMCPWCLVGWGGLKQALGTLEGEIEADIRWHAFELNPDMPQDGEERTAHIARKYGRTLEQSRGVQDQMREAAQRLDARRPRGSWCGLTQRTRPGGRSSATRSRSVSSMSTITRFAPSSAKRRAVAAPMPDPAPVIITVGASDMLVSNLALSCKPMIGDQRGSTPCHPACSNSSNRINALPQPS